MRCNIAQSIHEQLERYDFTPKQNTFRMEILQGLQKPVKELPSKYFYDEVGSQLFDRITELDDYYLTRTELEIMQNQIQDIASVLGPECMLIEYGSGRSIKTRQLLDHLQDPVAYVPIDISREHLLQASLELEQLYPQIEILPICADYTSNFKLPRPTRSGGHKVAYYPGSTIGNFDREPARQFLSKIAHMCGKGGGLLIGVDLKKDFSLLHQAYNDREGITAQFNLHLLERLNTELDTNFVLDQFGHYAFYNPGQGRIEMHLVSLTNQQVHIAKEQINFSNYESIWTESSYKYTLEEFGQLAAHAGFQVEHVWLDRRKFFSIQYLSVI
ncbi:dimethylhistidine N-methyltransferase [Dictyobacter alpinus]|uniref:Dimethylhistidine N-methyltransferase n=1 Tax=Dictyobacter alpinus TaxID=2014873 RepID=A0A402AZZ2_9CHLR|nr:L-histidine N(alpha)-methyltransferase [Dictyobacter alpinus]GCE24663.1 dimethylhistidine N-methyltransferase [Dictyobacter alpinus]